MSGPRVYLSIVRSSNFRKHPMWIIGIPSGKSKYQLYDYSIKSNKLRILPRTYCIQVHVSRSQMTCCKGNTLFMRNYDNNIDDVFYDRSCWVYPSPLFSQQLRSHISPTTPQHIVVLPIVRKPGLSMIHELVLEARLGISKWCLWFHTCIRVFLQILIIQN